MRYGEDVFNGKIPEAVSRAVALLPFSIGPALDGAADDDAV